MRAPSERLGLVHLSPFSLLRGFPEQASNLHSMGSETLLSSLKARLPRRVRNALHRLRHGTQEQGFHSEWSVLNRLDRISQPHVVIDAGAHSGGFIAAWKQWSPAAEIHAFEADEEVAAECDARFAQDPSVKVNSVALGAQEEERTFFRLEDSRVSSSFLSPDPERWEALRYTTGEIKQGSAKLTSLDSYCKKSGIDRIHLLKIDVQGYEIEVLRGSTQVLQSTAFALIESGFRALYSGGATVPQVLAHMSERDFHLIGLQAWHPGNQVLTEADLLFRHNGLEGDLEDVGVRVYESS